jgi:hypothetical protein
MSEVTRYEYPAIFVTSRRTGETFRFLVHDEGALVHGGTGIDEFEARRTATSYLNRVLYPRAA